MMIISNLYDLGYEKVPVVTKTGEMAIRGYVIDVFPITYENPIRIDFWGDTIDSIKYFDLDSQISNNKIDEAIIYSFTEFLVDNTADIEDKYRKQKYLLEFSNNVGGLWDYIDDLERQY